MPKYIEKENLPQFKYYNFCEGDHDNWGEEPKPFATYHISNGDDIIGDVDYKGDLEEEDILKLNEEILMPFEDNMYQEYDWKPSRDKWVKEINAKKGKKYELIQYVYVLIRAMHKDRFIADQWKARIDERIKNLPNNEENELTSFLNSLYDDFSFATALRTCQGFPMNLGTRYVYPKMLLIESEFYNKQKNSDVTLDYNLISDGLRDVCYVISINGESAEKRMCFMLTKDDSCIILSMLDRNNGLSAFSLRPFDEYSDVMKDFAIEEGLKGNTLISPLFLKCHPRGDFWCENEAKYCLHCDGKHNCKHKMLNVVAAIFYCFQEYIWKIKESKTTNGDNQGSVRSDGKKAKPFVPSGMIRMYDIKYSAEELVRINKYANFGKDKAPYTSTEKAPHVRRGTMRFNPKTGQKDIMVRGSIIHKDRYEGFSTAERVKE